MDLDVFFALYRDLPQLGPGSDTCTRVALTRLPPLPPSPRVVDVGCGVGRQTRVLAETLRTRVLAIDLHPLYLEQLERDARARNLESLIETRAQDMGALELPAGSVDLLWSEGAIYHLGFGPGLRRWRPLLTRSGLVAVTELSWLTDDRPAEAVRFWHEAYPTLGTVPENRATAEREGYEVLDTFALPASAWWDYYTPLLQRIERMRPTANADLLEVITATEREIALFRAHGHSYGYVFYLLRNRDA
ncbi:class I SAM-dependent methyltransferase [Pyxidicoccus fallax]|uniref:Class I SAM-dependent methyltransferase n=1 Tax=Pyxidicoccus fallax TaxID=394095 RepID=A0A848LQN7_9BACT|nr:class I SAM-dependent methyltransferase [Pyxidicoccus fallax]NMO20218.1 class I SAM-dependent methyltransferase [Pyxidicoccus fallax]NPC84358.1 class I SAM-dependent methyltransferase [Pyxidicoccus fallax]